MALTVQETATALGVSRQTVYNWIKDGTVHGVRLGGAVRVPVAEIDRVLARPA